MAKAWSKTEKIFYTQQLRTLYCDKNKAISEIAHILSISPNTVYDRLMRFNIPTNPKGKAGYCNKRQDIKIPTGYSEELAEFFGIMLDDGKLSHFQVAVTLGNKEIDYAKYVSAQFKKIFTCSPNIITSTEKSYRTVYVGSIKAARWLKSEGLVYNKVAEQVDIPRWIFRNAFFMKRFARGFFDTDGSIYKLRYGTQLSFTNYSKPLLLSLQRLLRRLGYSVSEISGPRFYITKSGDIQRFFTEISPQNQRHIQRFHLFSNH